jgi:hypothetical protein
MKIEELQTQWASDAHIDTSSLVHESSKVPLLHSKYYAYLLDERLLLLKLKHHQEELSLVLEGFFSKTLTSEELSKHELVYSDKRVLKVDLEKNIAAHPKMVALTLKIGVQHEKVKFLEDILKMIHNRNFTIKNVIDMKKFDAGM